jgi:hypothetical protein
MTMLGEVIREVPFPVYGIRPVHWAGPSYVGDSQRTAGRLTQIALVYQQEQDLTSAVSVSSVDAAASVEDPIGAHLGVFVARFDPGYLMKRNKPHRSAFPEKDFTVQEMIIPIGGQNAAAYAMRHKRLPLELLRVPLRAPDGITDIGVAGWRAGVRDIANLVERVDAAFAREMDKANQIAYPFAVEDPPPP